MIRSAVLATSFFLASLALPPGASAQTIEVFNAASFAAAPVAPGSIVSIFGTGLSASTATIKDPSAPPTTLAGTSVTVGGVTAGLFYVSPVQINAVLSSSTPTGTENVVVTTGTTTITGTVTVSASAPPGLFSLTGSGSDDGAIIQALTGRVGAFSVNDGTKSNFLSLFLTGADLSTTPTVLVGGVSANVTFAGASPCCEGLQQINVTLPSSLAGAGRVPVIVQAGGQTSNAVEIVILPAQGQGEFNSDQDNATRSRELSAAAWIPGTSLALVTDENDDVVREIDLNAKSVVQTISIGDDSEPVAIAVNSAGTTAFVAERKRGRVAVIDLSSLKVTTEIPVGAGPVAIGVNGNTAVAVNGDNASVTIIDLTTLKATGNVTVGRAPRGLAFDAAGLVYVTNQNDGTISVVDPVALKVTNTISLGTARPQAIQLLGTTGLALVTDPATAANGKVLVVSLAGGTVLTSFSVNVEHTGGAGDLLINGTTAYVANQAGGSISVLPLTISGTTVTGTATKLQVDQGVRSLAIDTKDNLLLVVNESTGRIAEVSLASNTVVGRINAVASGEGNGDDDHSDHDDAGNMPQIVSITPANGAANSSFTMTIAGTNLQGATAISFFSPAVLAGVGKGDGQGSGGGDGQPILSLADTAFTVTNIQANTAGTQLTATVAIAAASPGVRVVRVSTPNGTSGAAITATDVFVVTQ